MNILRKKQQLPSRRSDVSGARAGRATENELAERYAFRRNRTLTGSLAPGVVSVNEHHAELKSVRIHTHDLRQHRRRLSGIFLIVALVAVALGYGIFQSIAIPKVVAVATERPIDAQYYEQKIQQYLNGRPLERSRVALNVERLAQYLQVNDAPEVLAVSPDMSFDGLGTSRLQLVMRRPVIAWRTGSSNLYVDDQGVAFARNYHPEPTVKVVDETGIVTKDNKVLASNRFLGFIGRVVGRMKASGLTVTQVALPANTTRQVAVTVEGVNYPIKYSVDRPVGEQTEDAVRAIRYLADKGIGAEYLDVRVSGKAFYK